MAGSVSMEGWRGMPADEVSTLSSLVRAAVAEFLSSWLGID